MSVQIWNVHVEAHEWQCEPANEAARDAAERAEYPSGPMVPVAELDALIAAALECADSYEETVDGEWGPYEGPLGEAEVVREAVAALRGESEEKP